MAISQERKNEIHNEVRQELKRLIQTWGALLGITNILALLGVVFYLFFLLPKNAVEEAKSQMYNEIYALQENLVNQSSNALIEVGKIQGRVGLIDENTDSLQTQYIKATELLNEIQSDISNLVDADRRELALIVERLAESPNIESILAKIASLNASIVEIKNRLSIRKWETPQLVGNWTNYGSTFANVGYCKDGLGVVFLKGLLKNGETNATIFTLPQGYRPQKKEMFDVITYGKSHEAGRIDIYSTGIVKLVAGGTSFVSLSGISFIAAP